MNSLFSFCSSTSVIDNIRNVKLTGAFKLLPTVAKNVKCDFIIDLRIPISVSLLSSTLTKCLEGPACLFSSLALF